MQVQGTVNGIGERCGNVDLCPVIAGAALKLGVDMACGEHLDELTALSAYVDDVGNIVPVDNALRWPQRLRPQGRGARRRDDEERADVRAHQPPKVGNVRRVLVSELAGLDHRAEVAEERPRSGPRRPGDAARSPEEVAQLEHEGYSSKAPRARFELLMQRAAQATIARLFELIGYRVIVEKRGYGGEPNHRGDDQNAASKARRCSRSPRATARSMRSTARCAKPSGSLSRTRRSASPTSRCAS